MSDLNIKGLILKFEKIANSEDIWNPNGVKGCTEENFVKNNPNADKSIFSQLDMNGDGYISEFEYGLTRGMDRDGDGTVTDAERTNSCMEEMKYFARRDIDKWFKVDKNRDGLVSNVEGKAWGEYNVNGKTLNGPLSNEELAIKYNMKEPETVEFCDAMQQWISGTIYDLKSIAQNHYGIELSDAQIIEIQKEMKKQLNTWLFKTGDNKDAPFYQQLNSDAYTRLISTEDGVSCCGGDICELPEFSPSNLDKNGKYTAAEIKARLKWAENSYKVDDNGKIVYDEKGNTIPAKMMTEEQVQKYKELIESVTGKNWEDNDWEISKVQWYSEVMEKVNGTYGDEDRLQGKTRADIPDNRQALLRYLEEQGLLYDQFKIQ